MTTAPKDMKAVPGQMTTKPEEEPKGRSHYMCRTKSKSQAANAATSAESKKISKASAMTKVAVPLSPHFRRRHRPRQVSRARAAGAEHRVYHWLTTAISRLRRLPAIIKHQIKYVPLRAIFCCESSLNIKKMKHRANVY